MLSAVIECVYTADITISTFQLMLIFHDFVFNE